MARHLGGASKWLPAAHAGSQDARGIILEACRKYLLWVARRQLDPALQSKGGASDIVQETMLEAQRDFDHFRGNSEAELLAWLRRLLLNNLANFARRYRDTAKRSAAREISLTAHDDDQEHHSDLLAAQGPQPVDQVLEREQNELLQQALAKLPDESRQVIQWWYQEQLSFEEIGRRLQRAPNTARKIWMRAIEQLHSHLESLE
jgi:RNA polymerase sigma-70 factor (ECF subfamily)